MQSAEAQEPSLTEMEARIARLEAENAALRTTRTLLQSVADHAPAVIYVKDRQGRFLLSNRLHAQLLGLPPAEVIGKREADLFPPEVAAEIDRVMEAMFQSGTPQSSVFELELEGRTRSFLELMFPIRDEGGEVIALGGISNDITERREAQEENAALQAEMIETQGRVIRELSAPLIPLSDGVLVMPLIGSMSRQRAGHIARELLERVHAARTHTVLLDVTGMLDLDDDAVEEFARIMRAARLLGARTLLTGVGPALAKRFLAMPGMLREIKTVGTLQTGVALALRAARTRG